MQVKSNIRGFTLVELLIAVSLLSVVLAATYYLLAFTYKSYRHTVSQYEAEQDARMAMISLEEDIRKAKEAEISGIIHNAVEVTSSGMQLDVYTDVDKDDVMEFVQYKLENNELKRGEAELNHTPTKWTTLACMIYNNTRTPKEAIFTVDDKRIDINLVIGDENNHLKEEPVSLKTSVTVRSKGAMQ